MAFRRVPDVFESRFIALQASSVRLKLMDKFAGAPQDFRGTTFRVAPIATDDGKDLENLIVACSEFSELMLGHPPGPAEAQSLFYSGPDNYDPKDKILLGIRSLDNDDLIGVIDGCQNYPGPGIWFLGLLLLTPRVRGKLIGREVVDAFSDLARRFGAHELQLNVAEENTRAHKFWGARGFAEVRRWRQRYGEHETTFIRMSKTL
jgi:GNAT superfamily N-acetyltransferase